MYKLYRFGFFDPVKSLTEPFQRMQGYLISIGNADPIQFFTFSYKHGCFLKQFRTVLRHCFLLDECILDGCGFDLCSVNEDVLT